jgi:alpha-1,2-mannosyltransferase
MDLARTTKLLLLVLTLLYAGVMVRSAMADIAGADGLVMADGASPLGGDFINMFAAARMVLEGQAEAIYQPDAFMAFEQNIIPADIGLRLWAYPPHSLLLVWPLGWLDFWTALGLWSLLGLAALVWGARSAGFDWIETIIIALSPAALASVYFGQTGNLAAGLLLLALSSTRVGSVAAGLLTIKPQAGFLLPVLWLVERKWLAIAVAAAVTIGLAPLSLLVFGVDAWRDYLGPTLTTLNALERHGSGPFMVMIPSVFIGTRLLAADATLASLAHGAVAVAAGAYAIWRLTRADDARWRWAILIAAMAVITPYIHIYDLAPLVAAALIVLDRWRNASLGAQAIAAMLAIALWALPLITVIGNTANIPAGPLVLVLLMVATTIRVPSASPLSVSAVAEKSPS